ncbi:hypothetical protein BKA93DRAFT_815806 [Sparassis latifolia]
MAFPEPQLFRSSSQSSSVHPNSFLSHSIARSEDLLSPDFSPLYSGLESEEGLRRFQSGDLPENDEEWYRLVPAEAREVLGKIEVQRQSNLFEIIKSERDYVKDLNLLKEVFIEPLGYTPTISKSRSKDFVKGVFSNLDQILAHHTRMLDALFVRQREQHPLIQSLADIILDACVHFQEEYKEYIEHYPLAEARHRDEMRRNQRYNDYIQQCSLDPRTRKRDLITFITRPVTRLPRLRLQLDTLSKHTMADHPDAEQLPLIMDTLSLVLDSIQPGIADAEDKVKYWNLCESLMYDKGEIIDLDLYGDNRTLVHSGPLARKYRSEVSYNWADLHVALLDNYLLQLKPETRSDGRVKRRVVSRPIPLEYLRLDKFDGPTDNRREKQDEGRLFEGFRSHSREMYPFTISHASSKSYTLYTTNNEERKEWRDSLINAVAIRRAKQDGNKWFASQVVSDGFFRPTPTNGVFTGKILSAVPFVSGGKNYTAVGCSSDFKKILDKPNTVGMAALPDFNKFIVHCDVGLLSYSLELLVRVATGASPLENLDASLERVSPDSTVLFFRAGQMEYRRGDQLRCATMSDATPSVVLYTSRWFLQFSVNAVEVVRPLEHSSGVPRTSSVGLPSLSFRPFGDAVYISKEPHNIVALNQKVGVCTDRNITLLDPTNLNTSSLAPTVMPNFAGADAALTLDILKSRSSGKKVLGLVPCGDETLVVFDELGCYVDKHGIPCRKYGYLRWESKATSYAHRGRHLLLFCSKFIEVRTVDKGKLVQVIEGEDVRLVHTGLLPEDKTTLFAMKGRDHRGAVVDKLVELVETSPLISERPLENWDDFS